MLLFGLYHSCAGEWRHGLRSGEGEFIAADGSNYIGQWAYDKVIS